MDPTPPTEPPSEPRATSSFERFEIPQPAPAATRRRPAIVTTAAIVLLVSGLLNGLYVVLFLSASSSPELAGVRLSTGFVGGALLLLAASRILAATLIFLLRPFGRGLGLALAVLGLAMGLVDAAGNAMNGLMTMAGYGFVIYALVAGKPAFDRR